MFLIPWVRKYIGIPFVVHGKTIKGCDCWGLVQLVFKQELKIELDDYAYLDSLNCEEIQEVVRKNKSFCFTETFTPKEFDLCLMKIHGHPCHIGIFVEPKKILHASYNIGVVLEDKSSPRLKGTIEGFYRYG